MFAAVLVLSGPTNNLEHFFGAEVSHELCEVVYCHYHSQHRWRDFR